MKRTSRRRVLRAGGLAGVAGASATAGCFGILGGGGGGDDGGGDDGNGNGEGTTTTQSTQPTFRWWLPAPEELYGDPRYSVNYYDLAAFRAQEDALHPQTFKQVQSAASAVAPTLGVTAGEVASTLLVGSSGIRVVEGTFSKSAVASHLTSADPGFSKDDDYGGFALYSGGQQFPVVAVGDGTALLVRGTGGNQPIAVARMLVDAHGGEATRYDEASDVFDLATADLPGASRVGASLTEPPKESAPAEGQFRGMEALAFGFTVGPDTTKLLMVLVFSGEGLASADDVRTWTDEGLSGLGQYNDYGVSKSGRTVRIQGNIDTGKFDFIQPGPPGGERNRLGR